MTETHEPIRTFEDANKVGAYGLARRWADSIDVVNQTADGELEQLAIMAALSNWLIRWQPIHVHRAALAGADRVSIAAAMGVTVPELLARWTEWAKGQRRLYEYSEGHDLSRTLARSARNALPGQKPTGLSADEYAQVAELLGVTEGGQ